MPKTSFPRICKSWREKAIPKNLRIRVMVSISAMPFIFGFVQICQSFLRAASKTTVCWSLVWKHLIKFQSPDLPVSSPYKGGDLGEWRTPVETSWVSMKKTGQRQPNTSTSPAGTGTSGHIAPEDKAKSTKLTKSPQQFASWNVKTLLSAEAPALPLNILQLNKTRIACMEAARLNGNGTLVTQVVNNKIFYCGTKQRTGDHGVGLAIEMTL